MKITRELWQRANLICSHAERHDGQFNAGVLADALGVSEMTARALRFAIENKDIIRYKPLTIESSDDVELVICDLHIPYHDRLAVETALSLAEQEKPTIITILGDLFDFYQISKFSKDPTRKSCKDEIAQSRTFLEDLRLRFPGAKIYYLQGNHEKRFETFIFNEAPQIYELVSDLIQVKLGLRELDIQWMDRPFRIGKLWHLHGHEKPGGAYNPEYITNVIWKYVHDHFIVGHYHRNQDKIFKKITHEMFWGGAVGYLAGELDYAILNKWNQGCAIIKYQKNGFFKPRIYTIVDGDIF